MTEQILVRQTDRVKILTFNRLEKKNALTQEMYGVLADEIFAYAEESELRALVVTGAGDIFTAGNDLQSFSEDDGPDPNQVLRFLDAISGCPKPMIAAINGPAIGIGLTMLLHFDLCFASESATFSAPFVQLGLVPEAASSVLLPAVVGMAVASDMFVTGRKLSAREALDHGLISRVFSDAELLTEVWQIVADVARSSPTAQRLTKQLVRTDIKRVQEAMDNEWEQFVLQLRSPDFAESMAARLQNRIPVYD